MEVTNVIKMYQKWIGAGLRPPFQQDNDAAVLNAAKTFLSSYPSMDTETVEVVGDRLSHSKYWPTFFDIDEVVREVRRSKEPEPYKGDLMKEAKKRGPVLPRDREEYDKFIRQTANRCFPKADKKFIESIIEGCPTQLFAQGFQDRVCAGCYNGEVHGKPCANAGHRSFLYVVPDAEEPLVYCSLEAGYCEKWPGREVKT